MSRRFSVTAAALVALAGCGSSKPGSVQSPAAPSAPVTANPSATAATSPPTSPPPSTQAAGPIDPAGNLVSRVFDRDLTRPDDESREARRIMVTFRSR
jgi:hypothetical protein